MHYWLLKSEAEMYSIDDLARDTETIWTEVRNFQARNFLRDSMKIGDQILFYHSNANPSGVAGVGVVSGPPVADPTASDPKSKYYDPKTKHTETVWVSVPIRFVNKFKRLVTLEEIKMNTSLDGILVASKGSRLSVQPLSKAHFSIIVKLGSK